MTCHTWYTMLHITAGHVDMVSGAKVITHTSDDVLHTIVVPQDIV